LNDFSSSVFDGVIIDNQIRPLYFIPEIVMPDVGVVQMNGMDRQRRTAQLKTGFVQQKRQPVIAAHCTQGEIDFQINVTLPNPDIL
jgi:hypothetical protein